MRFLNPKTRTNSLGIAIAQGKIHVNMSCFKVARSLCMRTRARLNRTSLAQILSSGCLKSQTKATVHILPKRDSELPLSHRKHACACALEPYIIAKATHGILMRARVGPRDLATRDCCRCLHGTADLVLGRNRVRNPCEAAVRCCAVGWGTMPAEPCRAIIGVERRESARTREAVPQLILSAWPERMR